jgi:hypothetical protein
MTSIISYRDDSAIEKLGEVCLIFEFLESRYCLVRDFTRSDIMELAGYMAANDKGQTSHVTLRTAHKILAETYTIIRRSGRCVVIGFDNVLRTEQIAWIGMFDTPNASTFGVHNRFVNSSMFTSTEDL